MVQTDKYKKGIIALSRKASEMNPGLGYYQHHFITKAAKFIVQLSNGMLEIDLGLAREYENNPCSIDTEKLIKITTPIPRDHKEAKWGDHVDTVWKKLFMEAKR